MGQSVKDKERSAKRLEFHLKWLGREVSHQLGKGRCQVKVCPFIPCPGRTKEILYPKPPPLHHRARPRSPEQKPSHGPRARAGQLPFCLDARAIKQSQPPALVSEGLPSRVRMRTDNLLQLGGQAVRFGKSPS